jgi:L-xylulose reductase
LLPSIAAAVIGGVATTGGIGSPIGAILGAAIIGIIDDVTVLYGISPCWQGVISGAIVVLAISFDALSRRVLFRSRQESRVLPLGGVCAGRFARPAWRRKMVVRAQRGRKRTMGDEAQEFRGRTVLITGAGKGIGRATAKLLASRGASILALSRTAGDLASLEAEIGCATIAADLADLKNLLAVIHKTRPCDLLVNCAGTTALDPFVDLRLETFDHIMTVNAKAPMLLAQDYARTRIAANLPGSIVNVSSDASFLGVVDHAAYCASKAALDALTRVMAVELGGHGIRVNSVNPNITMTDMGRKAWSDPVRAAPRLARMAIGRFLEVDEIAETIAFLLSDRASAITGVSLRADGGFAAA